MDWLDNLVEKVVEFCNFTGFQLAPHKCVISANEEGWYELEINSIISKNLDSPTYNLLKSMKVGSMNHLDTLVIRSERMGRAMMQ